MMMRSFDFSKDLEVMNAWLSSRSMDPVRHIDLPRFGLIAEEDGEPMGCVFLRYCEGDLGMLCSFEMNPSIALRMKNKVFDELLMCGRELAQTKGIRRLIAFTEKKSILSLLKKNGWKESHFKIVGTTLMEEI